MNSIALEMFKRIFLERNPLNNKYDYGKVLILGGSEKYPGAGVIASKASLVSGVGYVTALVDSSFQQTLYPNEVIRMNRDELTDEQKLKSKLNRYDSIVFGNGLMDHEENRNLLSFLLDNYCGLLVIDATGLSILINIGLDKLSSSSRKCEVILTPNIVEFSRLLGDETIYPNPIGKKKEALQFASDYDVYLFIKYYDLLLIDSSGEVEEVEGRVSSLGRAGTGDAFAGLLGGLLASADESPLALGNLAYSLLVESAKSLEQTLLPGSFGITKIIDNIPKALIYVSEEVKD